jgi:hypothetical protein
MKVFKFSNLFSTTVFSSITPQFILHFSDSSGTAVQLAFLDARRLGRVRLCESPLTEPPITELGFDPILCMPALKDFEPLAKRGRRPVKALLLDQSFSAGVGNWLAGNSNLTLVFPALLNWGRNRRDTVPRTDTSRTTLQYPIRNTSCCPSSPNSGRLPGRRERQCRRF